MKNYHYCAVRQFNGTQYTSGTFQSNGINTDDDYLALRKQIAGNMKPPANIDDIAILSISIIGDTTHVQTI